MPVTLEQWRAAVEAWNRSIQPRSFHHSKVSWFIDYHSIRHYTQKQKQWDSIAFIILIFVYILLNFYLSQIRRIQHRLEMRHLSDDDVIIVCDYHISSVVRSLLIIAGDVELNPGPTTMNLKMLVRMLHEVRAKWYDIGIQLDISTGTLDAIKVQNSESGSCLREMLNYWLRNKSKKAIFDALIEALASEPVGENTLAENTSHLYLTVTSEEESTDPKHKKEINDSVYKKLWRYRIDCYFTGGVLGKGAYGTVLEMISASGSQKYAGKMYNDIPRSKRQFVDRLCGELLLLKEVNHVNIVQTIGITFDDDLSPIILMECMRTTLQEYVVNTSDSIPLVKKAKLLCDVATGLEYLHSHSPIIIHRDLTATNVLLDATLSVAKISDFGNARVLGLTGTSKHSYLPGTQMYMPPEAFEEENECDSSFDIFSLGHLMLITIIEETPKCLLAPVYQDLNGTHGRSEVERRSRYVIKSHQKLGQNHKMNRLMETCLSNDYKMRETAKILAKTLSDVVINNAMDLPQLEMKEKQLEARSIARSKAPIQMDRGAATSHDRISYFTPYNSKTVFKYEMDIDKWTELPPCPLANFGLAIINKLPTAVEHESNMADRGPTATNALVSFDGDKWDKRFPPMITPRFRPAVVTSADGVSVIAAGGPWSNEGDWWSNAVEYYNSTTNCWSRLLNMPIRLPGICAALCGDQLYLLEWGDSVYTCYLQALVTHSLQCTSMDDPRALSAIWKAIPNVPTPWGTPVSVCGKLIVVGGHTRPEPTNTIHLYDNGKWICIGHMSYSRKDSIVAVPSDDRIIVVGGLDKQNCTDDVEIFSITS